MTADHKTIETVNPVGEKLNKRERTGQSGRKLPYIASDSLFPGAGEMGEHPRVRMVQDAFIDAWSRAWLRFAREAGVLSGSHGLTIMRERADAVGGTLTLVSQPGNGTKIEVRIPVTPDKQNTKMNGAGE